MSKRWTEYSGFDCEVYAIHAQCSERRTRAQVAGHDIETRDGRSDGAFALGGRAATRDDGHRNRAATGGAHANEGSGTEASGVTVFT